MPTSATNEMLDAFRYNHFAEVAINEKSQNCRNFRRRRRTIEQAFSLGVIAELKHPTTIEPNLAFEFREKHSTYTTNELFAGEGTGGA